MTKKVGREDKWGQNNAIWKRMVKRKASEQEAAIVETRNMHGYSF